MGPRAAAVGYPAHNIHFDGGCHDDPMYCSPCCIACVEVWPLPVALHMKDEALLDTLALHAAPHAAPQPRRVSGLSMTNLVVG